MANRISWSGVFPAVTTQFKPNFDLDIDATCKVLGALIDDGVSGLIICGTVGENTSLSRSEKVAIMEAAKDVSQGRVPVICGVPRGPGRVLPVRRQARNSSCVPKS